ncbi:hypothetical protein [Variovorax terrae]|uniref:Uncharacterized protein n=1 Tax=Variovorax terrae TaxID=2923278 RepID=A0A9X1VVP9_9BURK|nr:hypothetical protein [Variovorax terrae]MCJ0762884.1 hypothetical protein [Variovorax terrae]
MTARAVGAVVLLAALLTAAWAQPPGADRPVPLPDLSNGVTLRVAYVENPRLPALPAPRLDAILALTARQLQAHLGIAARFTEPQHLPIGPLFSALSPRLALEAERQRLDATPDPARLEPLVRPLLKDLREAGDLAQQRRFAAPYLVQPPADGSDRAFARALLITQHTLLRDWGQALALDGRPVIGGDRYNEYSFWNLLGSTELPYEVVITNQLIASAERTENSVHSAIRGGVSNGITTQSRRGRYQLVSILSSYPFTDASALAQRLRGGEPLSEAQADSAMALLLAHELGHQLLHLGHPFGNAHCLMTPPVALAFRSWEAALAPEQCPLGSSRAQTPGFLRFASPDAMFRPR